MHRPASRPARHQHGVAGHPAGTDAQDEARLLTSPSLALNTAARKLPDSRSRPRAASADDLLVDLLVGGHCRGGVGVVVVTGLRLETLHEREHEKPTRSGGP